MKLQRIVSGKQGLQYWVCGMFILVAATAHAQQTNPELGKLEGHWKVTKLVEDGKVIPEAMIRDWLPSGGQVEIAQNAILIKSPSTGKKEVRIFSVDGTKYPSTIDITTADKEKMSGIYRFDDGQLIVCLSDPLVSPRPSRFESTAGSQAMLMVLKKVPKPQKTTAKPTPKPVPVATPVVTDNQARTLLAGTWKYVDSVGALYITLGPDGTFYTVREVKELRLFQKTFVRNQISNGTWTLDNGVIRFNVLGSVHPERVGTASFFRLRTISATGFTFSDSVGLIGSATKVQ